MSADLIREQIELKGPMTFYEFVELALYHPKYGYYNRSLTPRGRQGDYFTSLQVSNLFPTIFAEAILSMKEALGTYQFTLIEMGSGNGEFLKGVLGELARRGKLGGFQVWAVERGRTARDQMRQALSRFPKCRIVDSLDEIDWMGGLEGCVFSNELFDALPFHRLIFNGTGWKEIRIGLLGGALQEIEHPLSEALRPHVETLNALPFEPGQQIEFRPGVEDLYSAWSERFLRGYVLTVDYGQPRATLFDPSRPNGTWRCFFQHKLNEQPLEHIGEQDITAHVDFTQLSETGRLHGFDPLFFSSQGLFLSHIGQAQIQNQLNATDPAIKKEAMAAVQQLIHPGAMGEKFWVFLQGKGVPLPSSWGAIPNRVGRLAPPK